MPTEIDMSSVQDPTQAPGDQAKGCQFCSQMGSLADVLMPNEETGRVQKQALLVIKGTQVAMTQEIQSYCLYTLHSDVCRCRLRPNLLNSEETETYPKRQLYQENGTFLRKKNIFPAA